MKRPRTPGPSFSFFAVVSILPASAIASTSSLPEIDFSALGTVAVVGSFAGVQLYDPDAPSFTYNAQASTLITRSSDGSLRPLGATDVGGRIAALCTDPSGLLFLAGNFTSIAGVSARNIASYNQSTSTFASLASGLDGPVNALACNGTTVFAGGAFTAPVGSGAGSGYAGNVAAWSTSTGSWSPPPFSGVNGAVQTIEESTDGQSLFLGGTFTTLFTNSSATIPRFNSSSSPITTDPSQIGVNGAVYASIASSLVPLDLDSASTISTTGSSSTSGFESPKSIFCPSGNDGSGNTWLLGDGVTAGSLTVRFDRPIRARGLRLGNTFFNGRGTRNFSITAFPNNQILGLTFASDPKNPLSAVATCNQNCPLSSDSSVPFQDFLFWETYTLTGFELNILGFYGDGAGLHLLQLLSEGSYDYAYNGYNEFSCASGIGSSPSAQVTTSGTWTARNVSSTVAGVTKTVEVASIPGGPRASSPPSLSFNPPIIQDGVYTIQLVVPGCQSSGDCATRTNVAVSVLPGWTGTNITTIVDQNVGTETAFPVYSGLLTASSVSGGGVTVNVGVANVADGGAPNSGTTYQIVADRISVLAFSTNGTIPANATTAYNYTSTVTSANGTTSRSSTTRTLSNGIYEFALNGTGTFGDGVVPSGNVNATSSLTNASGVDRTGFALNSGANVTTIVKDGQQVFFGGVFTYTNGSSTSRNVVSYSSAVGQAVAAPNGGLNGPVTSIVAVNGTLYAAGTFTATVDGQVTNLAGSASWNYLGSSASWQAMGTSSPLNGTIVQLGLDSSAIVAVGAAGIGSAMYFPATSSWNTTETGFFVGNLSAYEHASNGTFVAGNVVAALSNASPGGALLTSSGGRPKLVSFGFDLASSPSTAASIARAVTKVSSLRAARSLVKESLSSLSPRQAAASPVTTTLPSTLVPDGRSQVVTGAYWKNGSETLMLLGGNFATEGGINNIGLYNQDVQSFSQLPGESINGIVRAIVVLNDVAWIGGDFSASNGKQGLSTYALSNMTALDTVPTLNGYTGSQPTVNVIVQRPGFDSTLLVAGAFSSAGQLPCQSICSWDAGKLQWSSMSTGLEGVVGAIAFAGSKSEYLLAAGSFSINGTAAHLAQWNYQNSSWSILGSGADMPGPATAVSADGTDARKIYLAGTVNSSNAPYLMYWNGTAWADVSKGVLGSQSVIQQLVFVPLSEDHAANELIEQNRMLMVSGDLTVNSTAASSALFDGESWYPYLVTASSTGSGSITSFFYSMTNFTLSARHLSVGIVILISIAIALGVVFLLVLLGLLTALARRKEDSAYPVQPRPNEDVHVVHRPTSLLQAVGAATAVMLDKGEKRPHQAIDHDSIAGPHSVDGAQSDDSDNFEGADAPARARYSFQAEHVGELSVSAGEDLVILEASDANWYLVCNSQGQRGLMPASYLA